MTLSAQKFVTTCEAADIEASGLMFCIPLERPLLERSSVLLALQEAGDAGAVSQLPQGISSEAFFLWSRADPRDYGQALSWNDAATAIKVADVLADTQLDAWLQHLASHVRNVDWELEHSDTCLSALLSLPRQVLSELMCKVFPTSVYGPSGASFRAGWEEMGRPLLGARIDKLPVALHSAFLSSCIEGDGYLHLYTDSISPLLAAGISNSHLFGPELISLLLASKPAQDGRSMDISVLGGSVGSHTALTSLILKVDLREPEMVSICQHLPSLSRMRRLQLTGTVHISAVAALAQAFWCLPVLEEVEVGCIDLRGEELPHGSTSQAACRNFVQALATRTGLTHLHLNSLGISCPPRLLQGAFPQLQQLTLAVPEYPNHGHDFFASMKHVTALNIRNDGPQWMACRDASELTGLKSLSIDCDTRSGCDEGREGDLQRYLRMSPALQELRLTVLDSPDESSDSFPYPMDEYCPSLHTLHIKFADIWDLSASNSGGTLMGSLSRMHALRNLHVDAAGLSFSMPLPPHLTQLGLFSCAWVAGEMSDALSEMTGLQVLTIKCGDFPEPQKIWGGLKVLSSLTHFEIEHREEQGGELPERCFDGLCEALACLSRLQKLDLKLDFNLQQLHGTCGALTAIQELTSVRMCLNRYIGMPGPDESGEPNEAKAACQAAVQQLKGVVDQVQLDHHVYTFRP